MQLFTRIIEKMYPNDKFVSPTANDDFRLIPYHDQVINHILSKQGNLDYSELVFTVLKECDLPAIIHIMDFFKDYNMMIYSQLEHQFEKLGHNVGITSHPIYGFTVKIVSNFNKDLEYIESSLNTGDQIAVLINRYMVCKNNKHQFLHRAYNSLKDIIIVKIKQKFCILENEIKSQNLVSISNAFHLFFLYDKEEALNKFKKAVNNDVENRRFILHQLHHSVLNSSIFNRLNLPYIPLINIVSNIHDIILSEPKNSVSQDELTKIIDHEDFFNRNVPLKDFPAHKLINPLKDIYCIKEVKHIFNEVYKRSYIKHENEKEFEKLGLNLGEIFIETITEPYPKFSDHELIMTREITKELLLNSKSEFKKYFFGTIYVLKGLAILKKWQTKFPVIFHEYVGGLRGYSLSSNQNFFSNDSPNQVAPYEFEVKQFLKTCTSINLKTPVE